MSITTDTGGLSPGAQAAASKAPRGPAGIAAARVARAGVLLGLLGLVSFAFVFLRLFETWRVSPHTPPHHVVILGQSLSYPVANAAAVIILVLALLGGAVTTMIVLGAARELTAARSLGRRLAAGAHRRRDGALVIEDERPRAFCAGLFRPRVYVSSGALAILDEQALGAVLVHERHHAHRRDPLRLATSRVLARAMFFLPVLRELGHRQQALAEMSADESAVYAASGNPSALARAMLSFTDQSEADDSVGIDPARVDYLLGEAPGWRFPAVMCAAAIALLALVVATAVLAASEAAGYATLAPPFLSAQPCMVVLAIIPAAVGLVAIRLVRSRTGTGSLSQR
jgi:beta-lactamase regulating signal transducer with metallopeptidase domain